MTTIDWPKNGYCRSCVLVGPSDKNGMSDGEAVYFTRIGCDSTRNPNKRCVGAVPAGTMGYTFDANAAFNCPLYDGVDIGDKNRETIRVNFERMVLEAQEAQLVNEQQEIARRQRALPEVPKF